MYDKVINEPEAHQRLVSYKSIQTPQSEFPELLQMGLSLEIFSNGNVNSLEAKLVYCPHSSYEGHYVIPSHFSCLT